jgi:uncharacterized repeat protein (TIGR01451 family)
MATKPPGTPTVDLTDSGDAGVINDAVFMTDPLQPAGTGAFNSFVQIQRTGTEQGYNSDHTAQFDESNSAQHNHSVLLADVPIVIGDGTNGTAEGIAYRQFLLDLNEASRNPYISLDALQIWQEESGNLTNFTPGAGFAGAHTNYLAYNLDAGGDHWVALNDGLSHGSGQSDAVILIPNDVFINDAAHRYVTLYSEFGLQSGWQSDGGVEEWGLTGPSGGALSALALDKTATVPGGTADTAGEVITYSFALSNTGNQPLTGVTLGDPSVSDLTRGADIVGNNDNILDVGEVWSYTAHHTVTQADIDTDGGGTGVIENTATVASDQTTPTSASVSVAVEQKPSLSITKTPDVSSVDQAGDIINYLVTVTDTGNTTMTNPVVTDPQFTVVTPILDFNAPILGPELLAGVLVGDFNIGDTNQNGIQDPGETFVFVNAGDTNQNGVIDPGETELFTNVGDTNQNGFQDTGETFQYYNVGDTNHNGVQDPGETFQFTVSDQVAGVDANNDGFNDGDVNHDGLLNVGETWQFAASYKVTQADIDNGGVVQPGLTHDNTATVTTGEGFVADASASVTIVQNPHVVLTKDASVPGGTADAAGEVISYTITAHNDGNMTLTDPAVSDPSVSDLAAVTSGGFNIGDTNQDNKLSVGETWQYTANHTVTQAEMDAGGSIDNTASITTGQGATSSDGASIAVEQHPSVTLTKDASVPGGTADTVGEAISYTISAHNDGNVSLTDPVVTDPSVGDLAADTSGGFNVGDTNHDNKLSVGETWQYTASHTVTQADLDAGGSVSNTASITTDQGATSSDGASVPVAQNPSMAFTKAALGYHDLNSDGVADAGDTIDYSFLVQNTGNVTLHDIGVSDVNPAVVVNSATIAALAPGASDGTSKTATYTIVQHDVDVGFVDNEAVALADEISVPSGTVHSVLHDLTLLA